MSRNISESAVRNHTPVSHSHWGEIERPERRVDGNVHFEMNRVPINVVNDNEAVTHPLALSHLPRSVLSLHSLVSYFGDSFCGCYQKKVEVDDCTCGELGQIINWAWDTNTKSYGIQLHNHDRDVRFHVNYSGGTAVVRGSKPMTADQHYWEIKMTSLVYGTDMMVGVGTDAADIHRLSHKFCSILGLDNETWGLSYTGLFHHRGECRNFAPRFGRGSIIGVHLNMWDGRLSFYKNRQPLGVACTGLKGKTLYAMASSTAARSAMRIIRSCSFPSSLQFLCCQRLRSIIPQEKNVLDVVALPPGLKAYLGNKLSWLLGEEQCSSDNEIATSKHPNKNDSETDAKRRVANYILGRISPTACASGTSMHYGIHSSTESVASELSPDLFAPEHGVLFRNCNRYMSRPKNKEPDFRDDSDGSQNDDFDDVKIVVRYAVSSDGTGDELSDEMGE